MVLLIAGLILFIGAHSSRIAFESVRERFIASWGPLAYKGLISLASLVGLVLIIKGYADARTHPVNLWPAWAGGRHVAALLMLFSFVLVTAAYVPRNTIRARLKHPMVLGVKLWAFAHLIANQSLADLVLFGALLIWAVLSFRAARRRDAAALMHPTASPAAAAAESTSRLADAAVLIIGLLAYGAFATVLHASLIGVRPFG
ncbi:MAG: NnrU family protein [Betaproteobacteria bacterium]